MGHRTRHDEDDDEADEDDEGGSSGLRDSEGPDASDVDDGDDDETVPCPYCRKPVYEQAELCPHCGSFISSEDAPRRHPWWIWAGVAVCLIVVVLWMM